MAQNKYLHSSMDRLETEGKLISYKCEEPFTFQYG